MKGYGNGEFDRPNGVAVDSTGNVYVADAGNNRIQKFAPVAPPATLIPSFTATPTTGSAPLTVQFADTTTGNPTSRYWDFGDGYTTSAQNPSHLYSSAGTYTVTLTTTNAAGSKSITKSGYIKVSTPTAGGYVYTTQWGGRGSGDGQFIYPSSVAVDRTGNVYVTDTDNNRVQKFDSSGTIITKWGSYGSGDGQFTYPHGIAVDSAGNVYVVDAWNNRIQKFTSSGTFITKWGSFGQGNGQFDYPSGIAVDTAGNVYITDNNDRVQKFDSSGTFITKWDSDASGDDEDYSPYGVAVDSVGNVYVADAFVNSPMGDGYTASRIQKFTSTGTFITKWGSTGSGNGQFSGPYGIAVDNTGNVYVADTDHNRAQKFTSTGTFITTWGSYGSGNGQFNYPRGIAVDSAGNIYVADAGNERIQKFAPVTPLDQPSPTPMPSIPTSGNAPRDLTGDGFYKDINGNGGIDFNDVVLFFNQMDWIATNEPVSAFDFNKNGQIDFNDIVILFNEM